MNLTRLLVLLLCVAGIVGVAADAHADVIINVSQQGDDVVFDAAGRLNTEGMNLWDSGDDYGRGFISDGNNWYVAPGPGGGWQTYALTSWDGAFGTSTFFVTPPTSFSGETFFIWGDNGGTPQVGVRTGYVSNSAITSGMVFENRTIANLSMTPGTYFYRTRNDLITLNIGADPVPEPGTIALLGLGLAGLGFASRRRKAKAS